jgi:hypothetical protein
MASVGCIAFIATTAAACGTATQMSAGAKVQSAIAKLGQQKSVTMTIGLDATQQQVWTALKGETDFTRNDAKMLAGTRASMVMSSTTPLKNATKGDFAFQLTFGGQKDVVEYRSVNGQLYVKADVQKLMTAGGASSSDVKQFQSVVAAADKLPSSYKSIKDAINGQWIVIDPKAFLDFAKSIGAGASLPSTSTIDKKAQAQMVAAVKKALGSSTTFKDTGTRDGADHVTATIPAAKAADALVQGLKPLQKQLPKNFPLADLQNKAPHQNIVLDLAIKDGTLSSVSVDLAAFDKKINGKLPLTVGYAAGSQPVTAPAGAGTLNPQDIMGAVMQLMSGKGGALKGLNLTGLSR